ncbi:nucleotidyltransferase family protein [Orrella marina]|uniref:Uncharacterized protein n=1 Tax=Orrella marina TaxID=2163011 RepID=A0A2R4XGZ8_9BURK|nr:nucleotidyltransferase family protein [Orrella marina]AWB33061.1 hypothetical protein DBV39_04255 [Orrella marina]
MSQRVNDRFWRNAVKMQVGNIELLRPRAADLLLHVIVHGLRTNVVAPLRWAADAAMVLQHDGDAIDWADLDQFAASIKLRARLYFGLTLLNEAFMTDTPIKTDQAVGTWIEQFELYAHRVLSRTDMY